jgi:hypothetical protein
MRRYFPRIGEDEGSLFLSLSLSVGEAYPEKKSEIRG